MYGCGLLLQGIGSVTPKRRSNRKACIKVLHKPAFNRENSEGGAVLEESFISHLLLEMLVR